MTLDNRVKARYSRFEDADGAFLRDRERVTIAARNPACGLCSSRQRVNDKELGDATGRERLRPLKSTRVPCKPALFQAAHKK